MGLPQRFPGVTQGCGIGSPEPGTGAHWGLGILAPGVQCQPRLGGGPRAQPLPQGTASSQAQGSSQELELRIPLKRGIPQLLWTCTKPSCRAG